MALPSSIRDLSFKALNAAHGSLIRLSGGRVGRSGFGMAVVELHTTGRRSGRARVTLLAAPLRDEGRVVLVASKGGDDRDPDWYRNLVAQPKVELSIDGERRPFTARTASAEEKAELWPKVVAAYKGYAGYQRRSARDIPLVICEPR